MATLGATTNPGKENTKYSPSVQSVVTQSGILGRHFQTILTLDFPVYLFLGTFQQDLLLGRLTLHSKSRAAWRESAEEI